MLEGVELVRAALQRLHEVGWAKGKIGTFEGPNCLVGAAAYVVHGDKLTTHMDEGVSPECLNGVPIGRSDDPYGEIPGIPDLVKTLGFEDSYMLATRLNDGSSSLDELENRVEEILSPAA